MSGVTLVLGLAIWGSAEKLTSQEATPHRKPGWLDYLSIGAALLSLEAVLLFFFATAPEKLHELSKDLDIRLHPESYPNLAAQDEPAPGESDLKQTSGNWLWKNNGQRTLGSRGKVRPSNRPEVFLWPDVANDFSNLQNNLYLRSFTLTRYHDGVWKARPIATEGLQAEETFIRLHATDTTDLSYEISHGPNASGQSLLVGIPEVTAAELPEIRRIAPDTYRLPSLDEDQKLHRYRLKSRPLFFDPHTDFPAEAREGELTKLNSPALAQQLNLLALQLLGTQPQRLASLKHLLASRCQYSLETNYDPEADIMEEFLFNKRVGYCEHFATAAALLAREIGYPSRVAYGWSGGRYYTGSNMYVFRAKEAHAWAEVKIAGKGWVIFEATPPSRGEGRTSLANRDEKPPILGSSELDSLSLERADLDGLPDLELKMGLLKSISLVVAALGLLILAILAIVKRQKKITSSATMGSSLLPPTTGYLKSFQKACAALGHPMPKGSTLRAHLAKLESAGDAPTISTELLIYHYGVQYSGKRPDKAKEKQLLRQIKEWAKTSSSQ